jgi:hypothetical protein
MQKKDYAIHNTTQYAQHCQPERPRFARGEDLLFARVPDLLRVSKGKGLESTSTELLRECSPSNFQTRWRQ